MEELSAGGTKSMVRARTLPNPRIPSDNFEQEHHTSTTAILMADAKPTTKKFGKGGERSIPHHSQKASKYYPAEDVAQPKKVCCRIFTSRARIRHGIVARGLLAAELWLSIWILKWWARMRELKLEHHRWLTQARKSVRPAKPRASLKPGTVVILLAGRFRGKRVVLLKHLPQGVLLVTGPFKVNGVPLRRVNARYVIATSTSVDLKGVDQKVLDKVSDSDYFTKDKESKKPGEGAFFKQGEKPEVRWP
jgi:large subunit ribosomal protein L6e